MQPQEIVEKLKTFPLFAKLDYAEGELELYRLAEIVHEAEYEISAQLFTQGQPSTRLWYVLEGQVRLSRVDLEGITRHLRDAVPGDSFGATGLLVGDFHDATAEALVPTRMLYLERDEFMEIYQARARLRRHLTLDPNLLKRQSAPRLDWMREDELPVFVGRRHWFYLFRRIATPLFLWGLLIAFIFFALHNPAARLALTTLLSLPALGFILWEIVDWRNDRFVVTTQRVVHVEREGLFKERFEESALDNVQDIHELHPSLTSNLLSFGDLILQTAGETVQIDLLGISDPAGVREMIFREIERNRARRVLQVRGAIREVLERRLRLEPPPPMPLAEASAGGPASPVRVVTTWLHDLFFPPSWVVSADKQTVFWRRYWLPGLVRYFFLYLLWLAITVGGVLFLTGPGAEGWMLALWMLAEAANFGAILWFVEDWRNDYFQITPTRIILVERKPFLLSESRRETTLDKIQNISFDKPNVLARFFDYGHVIIETAGTLGRFDLNWVRSPARVQAEISKRQRDLKIKREAVDAQRRQEELLSWFATYDSLRGASPAPRAVEPPADTDEQEDEA